MPEKYKCIRVLTSVYEEIMKLRTYYSMDLGRFLTISEAIKLIIEKAKAGEPNIIEEERYLIANLTELCKKSGIPDEVTAQLIKDCNKSLERLDARAIKTLRHIIESITYTQKIKSEKA